MKQKQGNPQDQAISRRVDDKNAEVQTYTFHIESNLISWDQESMDLGQLWTSAKMKNQFPFIHIVAMVYLAIEPTSCECERVFSSAGLLITPLRSSMGTAKVEMMMFLHRNRRYIKGIKDMPEVKKTKWGL